MEEWPLVLERFFAAVQGNTRTGKGEGRGLMGLSGSGEPEKGKSFEM